jgi:hypothetical protein
VGISQSTLHKGHEWYPQWSSGSQFARRALDKAAASHDYLVFVTGHFGRFRQHVSIYWRCLLHGSTEIDECVTALEFDGLDNIESFFS